MKSQDKAMYLSLKEEKMEKINIKFDEKQLEEVVKKITEKLKEEKEPGTINGGENERI